MALNEYDELLTSGTTAVGNEYDALISDDKEIKKQQVAGSMFAASQTDPDRRAQAYELSKKTQLPVEVVERNFDTVSKKHSFGSIDYDSIIDKTPKLADWIRDPNNAALSKDDLEALGKTHQIKNAYEENSQVYNAIYSGLNRFNEGLVKVPTYMQNLYYAPANLLRKMRGEQQIEYRYDEGVTGELAKWYGGGATQAEMASPDLTQDVTERINKGDFAGAGRTLALKVLQNSPNQIFLLGSSLMGMPQVGLSVAGGTTAAQEASKLQEEGVDPLTQTTVGAAYGAVETVFESLGTLGVMKQWENAIAKQWGKQVSKEVMKDLAKTLGYSFMAEGNEEALTSLAQDFTEYMSGANPDAMKGAMGRALEAGLIGGVSGVAMTSPAGVAQGMSRMQQIQQVRINQEFYMSIGENAQESNLNKRLPEKYQEYVKELTKDGPVENVYIPLQAIEQYFQEKSDSPVKMASELNILQEYEAAKEAGTDVKISTAKMASELAGTEHYQSLARDVKFSPDGFTANELIQQEQEAKARLQEEQAVYEQEVEKAKTVEQEAREIRDNVTDRLVEAGLPKREAKTYAKQYEAFSRVMSQRAQISPKEFLARYGLRINGRQVIPGTETGQVPTQVYEQTRFRPEYNAEEDKIQIKDKDVRVSGQMVATDPAQFVQDFVNPEGVYDTQVDVAEMGLDKFERPFEIDSIEVSKKQRGKGIGSEALRAIEQEAMKQGADVVFLNASPTGVSDKAKALPNLIKFYEKNGYKVIRKSDGNADMYKPLDSEMKRDVTQTPAFKAWFGDSKVVDENGKPLVVYHGSTENISEFKDSNGIYFSSRPDEASQYALINRGDKRASEGLAAKNGNVVPAYVSIQNPYIINADTVGSKLVGVDRDREQIASLKEQGYDGIIVKNKSISIGDLDTKKFYDAGKTDHYIAFYPEQIKSVNNQGTFDSSSPNILYQSHEPLAKPFFYRLQQVIEEKVGNSVSVDQLKATVKDIKEDELVWSGFNEFIKDKQRVSKQELLDFLRANELDIQEVTGYASRDQARAGERVVEEGDTIYAVFSESDGDWMGSFADEANAEAEIERLREETGEEYNVQEMSYDGESTLEDGASAAPNTAKYLEYAVPGPKTNYREIKFMLPEKNPEITELPDGYTVEPMVKSVLKFGLGDAVDTGAREDRTFYVVKDPEGNTVGSESLITEESAIRFALRELNDQRLQSRQDFTSSHWDEANILGWARVDERVDSGGNKVLFINEIQSDWHQAGRKRGYKEAGHEAQLRAQRSKIEADLDLLMKEFRAAMRGSAERSLNPVDVSNIKYENAQDQFPTIPQEAYELADKYVYKHDERVKVQDEIEAELNKVPEGPLSKTWHEFVFKRMVRLAAEKGFDKIAWATGKQSADIYNLSKQVDSINIKKTGEDSYDISAKVDGGRQEIASDVPLEKVEDYVGKDLAKKVETDFAETDSGIKTYSGVDLEVGGEGMIGFYDKMIPSFAKKFGKKFGAQVKDIQIEAPPKEKTSVEEKHDWLRDRLDGFTWDDFYIDQEESDEKRTVYKLKGGPKGEYEVGLTVKHYKEDEVSFHGFGKYQIGFKNLDAFKATVFDPPNKEETYQSVHSMDITLELKKVALEQGFSLFQPGQDGPLGKIEVGNASINIELLKGADRSTFLHETGHFMLEVMKDLASQDNIPDDIKKDAEILAKWMGVESLADVKREQHEMFARAMEAYLMEGKAPSEGLRKVFAKFKTWLTDIYKTLVNLNVELTDDVRDVFDRMLATEDEIAQAKRTLEFKSIFGDPSKVGMSEAQQLEYLNAMAFAELDATETLDKLLLKEVERKQDKAYKDRYKALYNEEMAKAKEMLPFRVWDAIKGDLKLSKPLLERDYKPFVEYVPRGTAKVEGGMNPDAVAEIFGYQNGFHMMQEIMPYRKGLKDFVEREVATRLRVEFPELLMSPELSEEAIKAFHNDNYKKMKRLELEYLANNDPKVLKTVANRLIRRLMPDEVIRKQARQILAKVPVRDIRPHQYRLAERRFAKEAADNYVKGEFALAFEAKQRELLNIELYIAANEAKAQVEKSVDKFKKLFRKDETMAKNYDMNLLNTARAVLATYGLGRTEKTAEEYLAPIKRYEPQLYDNALLLLAQAMPEDNAIEYKYLTYDQFTSLSDAVTALADLARSSREMEIEGRKINIDDIREELIGQAAKVSKASLKSTHLGDLTKREKFRDSIHSMKASLVRIEHWADAMDVKFGGPFRKYLFQPVSDAATIFRLKKYQKLTEYKNILKRYQHRLTDGVILAPELGRDENGVPMQFKNKAELMMAVLHSGNNSNLYKLLAGWGLTEMDDAGDFDRSMWDAFRSRMYKEGILNSEDMDMAQEIWNLMESMKPETQRAHKKIMGFYFSEITANEIETPFGTYKGGYIPAKADPKKAIDANIREQKNAFDDVASSFSFPTTGRGATMSRVDRYAAPLRLDMNMLGSHIDWAMRFTYIEPVVRDVARVVMGKAFQTEMNKLSPHMINEAVIPWLQRAAQQTVVEPSRDGLGRGIDTVAKIVRSSVGRQIMFANVPNAMQQFTGVIVAAAKVKPKYLRNALVRYISSPNKLALENESKSEWLQSTQGADLFEVHQAVEEIITNPSTFEKFSDFTKRHAYFLQVATQNAVNTVVWSGAYEEAISNGKSDAEAVKYADAAVRLTQGSMSPEDVSRFETGTATQLLFKQFVGYFNMLANLNAFEAQRIAREMGIKKGKGNLFYLYLTGFAIPAILSEAIMVAFAGKGLDQDDDDEYLDDMLGLFFGSQVRTALATVPFGGQTMVATIDRFTKGPQGGRLNLSPVVSTIDTMVGVPAQIAMGVSTGEIRKKGVRDALMAMGVITGLPLAPLGKPIGYMMDVESGKASPSGPIDFTRGLVTGKPGR